MRRIARILGFIILGLLLIAGAALLIFRNPDTDPAAMRAKYAPAPSQFVDLGGGLTVHLRDTGPRDAPVLMLLHGSNASLHTWQPWANRLEQRYRVIRFDQIGHGLTGPSPTRDYSAAAFIDTVEKVRVKLGLDRFVLAGNSMGGGIAWRYALAHPAHVSGLILVDSVGQPEPGVDNAPLAFRVARMPVIKNIATMVTPRSLIADSLPAAFSNPKLADAKMVDLYWELLLYPGNRAATIDRFATKPEYATPERLARLVLPVLILWGDEDRLIPASSAKWLQDRIPGSNLIVYPKTGHIPMEERADQSAADVHRFIETKVQPPQR